MTTIQVIGTTVEVLGKTYQIKCPTDEVDALQQAAQYLEEKMQEVRSVANVLSMDRIAVIAALNVTHQLLTVEHEKFVSNKTTAERLRTLQSKLEETLARNAQMELDSAK